MSGIKYYDLRDGKELPEEFVVIRHVDGEPKFITSYINTSYLSYENGVLLKMHERNDKLRAENAKLVNLIQRAYKEMWNVSETWAKDVLGDDMRKFGIEVDKWTA